MLLDQIQAILADFMSKSNYYYDALKLIKNKSFKLAIENLNKAEKNSKNDPDIYNYLGFSYRKMGNKNNINYEKALKSALILLSIREKCLLL